MRHLISIAVLLTVFFWAGPGSVRHVFVRSVFVVAASDNSKMSAEETQAKAQAERHYDTFMRFYNRIWSIYGFYHKEFNGTPGNVYYARIVKNWRNYGTHKKALLDRIDKLAGPTDLDAQAKAEGFADRNWQLKLSAIYLNSDIEYTHQKLTKLIKTAAEIGVRAQVANAAMNKACAAKTKTQAKPLAEQSKKAASQAISRYKSIRWIFPEIEKKRDKYMALRSELQSLEPYAMQHRDVYKDMIDSENALLKDRHHSYDKYFQNKRDRLHQLVTKLDKHHSELKRVLHPYQARVWAKAMTDNAHAARVRVGTIYKLIQTPANKDLWGLGETFRDRNKCVSIPERFDVFIGVGKKLETFFGLVSSIQELHKPCKASAIAARDDAKKALSCAQKLPTVPPNSNKDYECPSSWNRCGSHCCPPDVPCWNYEAIERAVKAGRCR